MHSELVPVDAAVGVGVFDYDPIGRIRVQFYVRACQ